MPIRTTSDLVIKALDADYNGTTDVNQHIAEASLLINRVVTCASRKGSPLSSDEAEMLERLVAAHNYACVDQPYSSRSTSSASGQFQGQTNAQNLGGTKYGQRALLLDYSGCLQVLSKRQVASAAWLGTCPPPGTPAAPPSSNFN